MCLKILEDSRLSVLLLKFDGDLAEIARASGCSCGGALHSARYGRKPRGWVGSELEGYDRRHSFCCAEDGCRKRTTPASVRFLGPKVYLGAVVALVTALRHGASARRAADLRRAIGASRRTLARWRTWWREMFTATPFWRAARAQWVPAVSEPALPASLLERFVEDETLMRLVRLLEFISPHGAPNGGQWILDFMGQGGAEFGDGFKPFSSAVQNVQAFLARDVLKNGGHGGRSALIPLQDRCADAKNQLALRPPGDGFQPGHGFTPGQGCLEGGPHPGSHFSTCPDDLPSPPLFKARSSRPSPAGFRYIRCPVASTVMTPVPMFARMSPVSNRSWRRADSMRPTANPARRTRSPRNPVRGPRCQTTPSGGRSPLEVSWVRTHGDPQVEEGGQARPTARPPGGAAVGLRTRSRGRRGRRSCYFDPPVIWTIPVTRSASKTTWRVDEGIGGGPVPQLRVPERKPGEGQRGQEEYRGEEGLPWLGGAPGQEGRHQDSRHQDQATKVDPAKDISPPDRESSFVVLEPQGTLSPSRGAKYRDGQGACLGTASNRTIAQAPRTPGLVQSRTMPCSMQQSFLAKCKHTALAPGTDAGSRTPLPARTDP